MRRGPIWNFFCRTLPHGHIRSAHFPLVGLLYLFRFLRQNGAALAIC